MEGSICRKLAILAAIIVPSISLVPSIGLAGGRTSLHNTLVVASEVRIRQPRGRIANKERPILRKRRRNGAAKGRTLIRCTPENASSFECQSVTPTKRKPWQCLPSGQGCYPPPPPPLPPHLDVRPARPR